MRILLADDQYDIRSALRLVLEQDECSWQVIQEVESLNQLFEEVESLRPDLILLDWELQGFVTAGRATTKQPLPDIIGKLKSLHPELKILVLSGRIEAHSKAIASGADAFVSKGDPPEKLLDTLRKLTSRLT